MRVKVCDITDHEQMLSLKNVGATFGGFIFYPKSPRYVLRHMTTSQIKKENGINKVGVFVNAAVEEVLQMVDECRLHMVQLHGDESPKYCEKIADYISVVKAFRLSETDNVGWRIQEYMGVCDMFMFDTETIVSIKDKFYKTYKTLDNVPTEELEQWILKFRTKAVVRTAYTDQVKNLKYREKLEVIFYLMMEHAHLGREKIDMNR